MNTQIVSSFVFTFCRKETRVIPGDKIEISMGSALIKFIRDGTELGFKSQFGAEESNKIVRYDYEIEKVIPYNMNHMSEDEACSLAGLIASCLGMKICLITPHKINKYSFELY